MKRTLIENATIVNQGRIFIGSVLIEGQKISRIMTGIHHSPFLYDQIIDATGCYLLPGVIDEHVHFRDPGLTKKADITTESRAAAAGGITSIMDMPNTLPQTTTLEALDEKRKLMDEKSIVNYSCYFGATNTNYNLFKQLDSQHVCGIKLFMGSSTGNMLVDRRDSLRRIFGGTDLIIAAHCEDQDIIKANTKRYRQKYGDDIPVQFHAVMRSKEACVNSTRLAIELAQETGARLHVMHVSTSEELLLFHKAPLDKKRITAEACISHLLFSEADYATLGALIKCNPAIKTAQDKQALRQAVHDGLIDTIATDHAPHLLSEKEGGALKATSGMPMIQFSLVSMLELVNEGVFNLETIVEKMCHTPALLYGIRQRGFIREGFQADLVLVRPNSPWTVTSDRILSKCGWSPLEGHEFHWQIERTFVNGCLAYDNGIVNENCRGEELFFDHS